LKKTKKEGAFWSSARQVKGRLYGKAKGERIEAKGVDQVLKRALERFSPGFVAVGIAVVVLFPLASCGVKAPPQPREVVLPAPVEALAVTIVPEGLRITFTLPSKSLDGSRLKGIGGYRILREGPEGTDVREDIRFSVSEMRQKVGKTVTFLDKPPARAGTYRYCVVPVDAYGSHASRRRTAGSCWEGFLSD